MPGHSPWKAQRPGPTHAPGYTTPLEHPVSERVCPERTSHVADQLLAPNRSLEHELFEAVLRIVVCIFCSLLRMPVEHSQCRQALGAK